jgi:hypothetical protein
MWHRTSQRGSAQAGVNRLSDATYLQGLLTSRYWYVPLNYGEIAICKLLLGTSHVTQPNELTDFQQMHEPPTEPSLKPAVARALLRRPLHIIKLPSLEAVNALSEQLSASAAARKSEEDSDDDL